MKIQKENKHNFFARLERRWQSMPIRRQHRYALYFFLCYLLLTTVVIFGMVLSTLKSENEMNIRHIEAPVMIKDKSPAEMGDSITTILKNRNDER